MEHKEHSGLHKHEQSLACGHTKIMHDGHCDDHGPVEVITNH